MLETKQLTLLLSSELTTPQLLYKYEQHNIAFFEPWVPLRNKHYFSLEGQEQKLRSEIQEEKAERSFRFYIVSKEDEHTIIGDVGVSNIVRSAFQSGFLGYKICQNFQGLGLMTEALSAVLAYCFSVQKLHRIEANIIPGNTRSISLAQRLGFAKEGYSPKYLCINGVWQDHERWALINPNYDSL